VCFIVGNVQGKAAVTHIYRTNSMCRNQEAGVPHIESKILMGFEHTTSTDIYLRGSYNVLAGLPLVGWKNPQSFACSRESPIYSIPWVLRKEVFRRLDYTLTLAKEVQRIQLQKYKSFADVSAVALLDTLVYLRNVYLQDAIYLVSKYPNLPSYQHPIFINPYLRTSFNEYATVELAHVKYRELQLAAKMAGPLGEHIVQQGININKISDILQPPDSSGFGGTVPGLVNSSSGGTVPGLVNNSSGFGGTVPGLVSSSSGFGGTVPGLVSSSSGFGGTVPGLVNNSSSSGFGSTVPGLVNSSSSGFGGTVPGLVNNSSSSGFGSTVPGLVNNSSSSGFGGTVPGLVNSSSSGSKYMPLPSLPEKVNAMCSFYKIWDTQWRDLMASHRRFNSGRHMWSQHFGEAAAAMSERWHAYKDFLLFVDSLEIGQRDQALSVMEQFASEKGISHNSFIKEVFYHMVRQHNVNKEKFHRMPLLLLAVLNQSGFVVKQADSKQDHSKKRKGGQVVV
jgi:hypothetical protein